MRTYVRARRSHHPARGPGRVLRVGRAARRPAAARPAGDRRRWGRARGQLRGEGLRGAHGHERAAGQGAVPGRDRGRAADARPTPRRATRSSRCSGRPHRWSRACPSTRRSSRSAGCGGSRGRRWTSPSRLRRTVAERVGLPITVGVARTKFLAKVASGVAKPDGLLLVPPERRAGVPAPAADRAAVGCRAQDRGQAARPGRADGRAGGRASGGGAGVVPRPGQPGGTCTRWRTTSTRGAVDVHRRRRSIGSQRALGRRERSASEAGHHPGRDHRPARPPAARRAPGVPDRGAAASLRRLHPGHPLAHPGRGHRAHRDHLGHRPRAAGGRRADDHRARTDPARGVAGRAARRPHRAARAALRPAQRADAGPHPGLGPGPLRRTGR